MNPRQVAQAFEWLDHRRRGYVDVSDFYEKFQELKESELFYVFKFLDFSRKGAITLQDLIQTLSAKN